MRTMGFVTLACVFLVLCLKTESRSSHPPRNVLSAFTILFNQTNFESLPPKSSYKMAVDLWIRKSTSLSVLKYCKDQYSRGYWACDLPRNVRIVFKRVYEESAYLSALAGAAMMKAITLACSEGMLNCTCGPGWAGCPKDMLYAKKIVSRYFNLNKTSPPVRRITREFLQHNIRLGIQIFASNVEKKCVTRKGFPNPVCWNVSGPFDLVVKNIKDMARSKMRYTKKMWFSRNQREKKIKKRRKLIHLHDSTNVFGKTSQRRRFWKYPI